MGNELSLSDSYDGLSYINGTIIIVTDDMDINTVLSGTFALNGFKTFKASTAEEALKTLDEHFDKVDSMIVDGMIAADRQSIFIVAVKKKKPSIKILVVSNNIDEKTRVLEYGADEFTIKPMSADMLTNKMLTLLRANRGIS